MIEVNFYAQIKDDMSDDCWGMNNPVDTVSDYEPDDFGICDPDYLS